MDVYPLKALAIDRLSTSGLDYITVLLRLYLIKSHGIPFTILVLQVLSCLFYRGPECFSLFGNNSVFNCSVIRGYV